MVFWFVSNVSVKLKATMSCKTSGTRISDIRSSVTTIISNYGDDFY